MLKIKKACELTTKTGNGEWLIDQVIPSRSLVILSAAPKLGKSMIALELCTSLCSGSPAFGKYGVPRKGRVLYYAGEDAEGGFKKRLDGFATGRAIELSNLDFYTVTEQTLEVDNPLGQKALCEALDAVKPDLLVLDNLSRIHKSSENSATAMGDVFEFLQAIKLKYGCAILLIHHSGKNGSLRGSSNILSYYESAIFLKEEDGSRLIEFKFRNYQDPEPQSYEIQSRDGSLRVVLLNEEVIEGSEQVAKVVPFRKPSHTIAELVAMGEIHEVSPGVYK